MKKIRKSILCIGLIMLMLVSAMAVTVSAYNNGGKGIYSGDTRIGGCQIWTNNATTDKVLSGETYSDDTYNSMTVRVAYTYFDSASFTKKQASWQTETKSYCKIVNTEYEISNSRSPIEARGQFAINSNIARICKMYNNGQGVQACEDGDSCTYNN